MNEHLAIIEALEEGKLARAKSILTSHIMTALSSFDMASKEANFNTRKTTLSFPYER